MLSRDSCNTYMYIYTWCCSPFSIDVVCKSNCSTTAYILIVVFPVSRTPLPAPSPTIDQHWFYDQNVYAFGVPPLHKVTGKRIWSSEPTKKVTHHRRNHSQQYSTAHKKSRAVSLARQTANRFSSFGVSIENGRFPIKISCLFK